MKKIGITGGTGFIGKQLTSLLIAQGYEVLIFTTQVAKKPETKQLTYAHWNPKSGAFDINALKSVDAVVHLAGAAIAEKRWTEKRKKEILESRVESTDFLVSQLRLYAPECKTLIAASAIGFYGSEKGNSPFVETDRPGNDFLADTCRQWEAASQKANEFLRLAILRFGIVLGKEGGMFQALEMPMTFGIAPILGSGKQVISWIEINDLARLIMFALEHENVSGIYNAVAPAPVTQSQLVKVMISSKGGLRVPIQVPAFLLEILLGEVSSEITKSCKVSGQKILDSGFKFDHPEIRSAVSAILSRSSFEESRDKNSIFAP